MFPKRSLALVALMCGLIWAAPAAAGPGHHGGRGEYGRAGNVPSRVATRIKRAERALERAQDKADDGDATGAASALSATRRNLASALKSAKRRVSASADNGPGAIGAVFRAQHHAVEATAGMFDEADGALVDAIAQTLKAALDGRDDGIAAIAALPASDQEDYEYVLESVDEDIGDEIDAIDEALADDTLSADARTALEQARTQLEASRSAVRALAPAGEAVGASGVADDSGDDRECDEREGVREGRGGLEGGPEV